MFFTLLKQRPLKAVRSISLSRKLISGLFILLIRVAILGNLLIVGLAMESIIREIAGKKDVIGFLNTYLVFFFLTELIYRFFLQKISSIELANYLHLPVGRSNIIHFLLLNSFTTPLNIVTALLFVPIALVHISQMYGSIGALYWLFVVLGISWSIHWFIGWFKQKYEDSVPLFCSRFCLI